MAKIRLTKKQKSLSLLIYQDFKSQDRFERLYGILAVIAISTAVYKFLESKGLLDDRI